MKSLLTLLLLGQILMAATIDSIKVNGIIVPFIYEEDRRLPLATSQIIFTNSGSIKNREIPGLASFSSKLLNEGTKKLGSSAFAESLDLRLLVFQHMQGLRLLY